MYYYIFCKKVLLLLNSSNLAYIFNEIYSFESICRNSLHSAVKNYSICCQSCTDHISVFLLIVFIFYWKRTYDIMPNYHVLIAVMTTYNLYSYRNFLPILKNLIKIFIFDCIRILNCTQLFLNLRSKTCRRSFLAYIQDLHKKSLKLVYGIGYFRSKMVDQLNKLSILK